MRNVRSYVPSGQGETVDAFVRTIFAQPNVQQTRRQLCEVVTHLEPSLPNAASVSADTELDVTAYAVSPAIIGERCGPQICCSERIRR